MLAAKDDFDLAQKILSSLADVSGCVADMGLKLNNRKTTVCLNKSSRHRWMMDEWPELISERFSYLGYRMMAASSAVSVLATVYFDISQQLDELANAVGLSRDRITLLNYS